MKARSYKIGGNKFKKKKHTKVHKLQESAERIKTVTWCVLTKGQKNLIK